MSSTARRRILSLFGTAITDQVLLSGTNFLVGLILIRFTNDVDYGLYVLVQSALLLLVSAQNAWVSGPLAVIAPKKSLESRREAIGAVKNSQRRILRMAAPVALLATGGAYLLRLCNPLTAGVIAAAVIAGWAALRREYLRSVLLIYSRPHTLLRADAVYASVLVAGVLWASFGTHTAITWVVAALAVAAWAGALAAHGALADNPGWVAGDAAPIWREMRALGVWSLLGATIYWLFGQSYSYVLASRLDLKAVSDVNAARLMLMPAFVLTIGMQGLLMPMAATWNAEIGFQRLMRRLLGILAIVGAIDIVYFGTVWLLRDPLIGDVLHKHIADRDRLLLLWAGVAMVGLLRDVLQCGLFALGHLKSLAGQVGISAVVALFLMWFGIPWWGAAAVLIGQIVGEIVNVIGIIALLRRHARKYSPL